MDSDYLFLKINQDFLECLSFIICSSQKIYIFMESLIQDAVNLKIKEYC